MFPRIASWMVWCHDYPFSWLASSLFDNNNSLDGRQSSKFRNLLRWEFKQIITNQTFFPYTSSNLIFILNVSPSQNHWQYQMSFHSIHIKSIYSCRCWWTWTICTIRHELNVWGEKHTWQHAFHVLKHTQFSLIPQIQELVTSVHIKQLSTQMLTVPDMWSQFDNVLWKLFEHRLPVFNL